MNDIGFVWSRRSNTWNENFQRLVKWQEQHGTCHIPDDSDDPELVALHKWVADQRVHYKRHVAEEEGNGSDETNSTKKKVVVDEEGNGSDGNNSTKRKVKRKLTKLSPEKIAKLKSIGFEFDSRDAKWLQKLDVLLQYKKRHGDFLVPSNYPEDPTLSNWVASQRAQYKLYKQGKKSHMTERRLKILTDAGFPFSVNAVRQKVKEEAAHQDKAMFDAKPWIEKYKDLLLFIATHGGLELLQKNDPFLAMWAAKQREECNLSDRTILMEDEGENESAIELKERIALIKAADFFSFSLNSKANNVVLQSDKCSGSASCNKEDISWYRQYGALAAWYIKHGTYASKGMPTKLKRFISKQQEQHRLFTEGLASELTEELIEKLDDIYFPFDNVPRDDDIASSRRNRSWEEYRLDLAISYIQKGNYDAQALDDMELRRWSTEQKRQHKFYITGKQTGWKMSSQ